MNKIESKISLQRKILSKNVSRLDLQAVFSKCEPATKIYQIKVYRNHSFEFIENLIHPFFLYNDYDVNFSYSDYDDSLTFNDINAKYDAFLLWIDVSRYNSSDIKGFIESRVDFLLGLVKKPILLCITGNIPKLDTPIPIIYVDSLQNNLKQQDSFFDERREKFTGTRISSTGAVEVAKELGIKFIPYILRRFVKAVVIDLDNTIYNGILGEDGVKSLTLTRGHFLLQQHISFLAKHGIFVCISSKNELEDVKELFSQRTDFPLRYDDFAIINASWDTKSSSILDIVTKLNIGIDSVLFIDDNIGELIEVVTHFPEINFINALPDGEQTYNILVNFPGLFRENGSVEDSLRLKDAKANLKRKQLISTMSKESYLKSLKMGLTIKINDISGIERISELSNKTNQFIFMYQRYTVNSVKDIMQNKNFVVLSFHLKDQLSDSGMIGALFLQKESDTSSFAILDELFISCRALGRGIETIIINEAILLGLQVLNVKKLRVNFLEGPRNKPAKNFYDNFLSKYHQPKEYVSLVDNLFLTVKIEGQKHEQ